MPNRLCKPDADLKRIWHVIMPGTPFPECGVVDQAGAATSDLPAPANALRAGDAPERDSS